jgi:hypothetical protein
MRHLLNILIAVALTIPAAAAGKPHVITFGKSTTIKWFVGADENTAMDLKMHPLYVDGHLKEFTIDGLHEVTDRLLVVRRVFRVNDSLPGESNSAARWRWQRGGWLLVDRVTARVTPINLPEFDPTTHMPTGIAIMLPTAACRMTARNCMRS